MKRLGIILFIFLIGYTVFYDITVGTLPMLHTYSKTTSASTPSEDSAKATEVYKLIEVKSGDTVLSIVEQISKNQPPSVEKIVEDFKTLNKNESPSKLRIGKLYKFPAY